MGCGLAALMALTRLVTRRVEKPWGRRLLWLGFETVAEGEGKIGEIWYERPDGAAQELLVKYLFTDEKLSVQVHPDDARARRLGLPRGKSEAWLVLDAEPGASIGLGLKREMAPEALRAAALDGSIEDEMEWPQVAGGDLFFLPAGTIHALGAGITVIEVQQATDVTYRLYDYGRPRELHVDAGVEAAHARPYDAQQAPVRIAGGRTALVHGPAFVLERWSGAREEQRPASAERPLWLVSVSGSASADGTPIGLSGGLARPGVRFGLR